MVRVRIANAGESVFTTVAVSFDVMSESLLSSVLLLQRCILVGVI